jgi:hypothetical protein
MIKAKKLAGWLLVLPLAMLPAACGDGADPRAALRDDELDRELDLAFQDDEDSTPPLFADVPEEAEPASDPGPQVQPPRTPQQAPAAVAAPRRDQPAPAPRPAPEPAPQPAAESRALTASAGIGTSLSLTLNQTLSTETNQVGDAFTATLQHAITDASGAVVLPAGATVRGRLTQVEKSGHVGATGIIKVAFENVSFGGNSYPLDATVVRANPQRQNRTSTAENAAKVGAGAAAGAVLGRVLGGNTRSTVRGAVAGAAAGTAIAMGTAEVDVILPEGSEMVIRLDSPIEVRRTVF